MPNRLLLTLADAIITAANENDAIVLPVGLAFAESLKQRPDLLMHQKDKSHPTAAGSYLYGAMLYGLLFKKSPEGMPSSFRNWLGTSLQISTAGKNK